MNNVGGKWSRANGSGLFVLDHVEDVASVGTSRVDVLTPDPDRIAILFETTTGTDIYMSIDGVAGSGQSFTVNASNNPVFINDVNMPGMAALGWTARAASSSSILSYCYVRIIGG